MVLGDDAALPDDLRDAFTTTSLSHLTAASGQNVMLLAALAVGLSVVAGIGIRARWMLALALIALYVPLAGGGPSVQTPVSPLIVCAPTPCSASEPIITRSSPRTYSCTSSPSGLRSTIG